MTTTTSSNDAAIKSRIITHMNADHAPSLIRYLEHYSRLPRPSEPRLEDLTPSYLIISSNGGHTRNLIPIDPPMHSYAEARERFIAMDAAALEGLGRSDIEAKVYERPRGWMAGVFSVCLATMVVFCRRGNLVEGSVMYGAFLKYLPVAFLRFGYTVQPLVFYAMFAIHLSEAGWMAGTRLRKHGVRGLEGLWWKWTLSTFVEGVGAFMRFDGVVKREEERLGRGNHETKAKGKETQDTINAIRKS